MRRTVLVVIVGVIVAVAGVVNDCAHGIPVLYN